MNVLPHIYLGYMFISLYFLFFFILIYIRNRKIIFSYPKTNKRFTISVAVPAYNEENSIEGTIKAIMKSRYPILELIVINDGSTDRTGKIVERLMKKYKNLKLINKKNSGKADSLNTALKIAKGELFAVVDSDSYPSPDSFEKLIGFFDDIKVGAVTCPILVRNRKRFIEKLQAIEYSVIALTRKLLDFVDAIYVTPGPLAIYRKSSLVKIGGFDKKNLTEDIEVTWHLASVGYKRRMCLDTKVTTIVPGSFKEWFRQRKRWNMGGLQTINKYKKTFMKKGMLGFFILPFFILSTFLGLVGLGIFIYLFLSRSISTYLLTKYSLATHTALVTLEEFYITPTILNYLGFSLFFFGLIFTMFALYLMREHIKEKQNIFNIMFYLLIYLTIYPFIMISSIYALLKKDIKW